MRAQLLPLDGGAPIEIVKDMTLVGRKEECDARLDHKSVSKLHCVIVRTDGLLLLRDLGSTNGTCGVNGQRIRLRCPSSERQAHHRRLQLSHPVRRRCRAAHFSRRTHAAHRRSRSRQHDLP